MSSGSNKKRKMSSVEKETKYYGVRAGHTPGVYETWKECQEMITGFKGAQCLFLLFFLSFILAF